MTAVVVADNAGDLLVADGNKYLIESIPRVTAADRETQRTGLPVTSPKEEAHAIARERLAAWTRDPRVGGRPLKYVIIKKDGEWKIRFLIQGHPNSFGFPKGGIEPGETALDAAYREFEEETGFVIPAGSLLPSRQPNVFLFHATPQQRQAIVDAWTAMEPEGELFNLRWMPAAAVQAAPTMNSPSRRALGGGRSRRRRRFTRKTRRN